MGLPRPAGFEDGGDLALEGRLRLVSDHLSDHRLHTRLDRLGEHVRAECPEYPLRVAEWMARELKCELELAAQGMARPWQSEERA